MAPPRPSNFEEFLALSLTETEAFFASVLPNFQLYLDAVAECLGLKSWQDLQEMNTWEAEERMDFIKKAARKPNAVKTIEQLKLEIARKLAALPRSLIAANEDNDEDYTPEQVANAEYLTSLLPTEYRGQLQASALLAGHGHLDLADQQLFQLFANMLLHEDEDLKQLLREIFAEQKRIDEKRRAGNAKSVRDDPLKALSIELYQKGSYPSTRNAAKRIANEVIAKAQEISRPIPSEDDFWETIYRWLIRYEKGTLKGFPKS
ncbi:hypothetical protein [Ferrimonas gelatinilytica]|uniref:Uncharacterized protein n=1 Tax=Ferrimonas gelatinilytica TaxID=1255257 RepID=A0ABP9S655_9GAMM